MSRPTQTLLGEEARKAVAAGVKAIYDAVAMTFGPQGKNALLYRTYNRGSRITNDGYTVAECQEPKNPFVRIVATAFREGSKRTNEKVGDGTTGTVIIGGKLMEIVSRILSEGTSKFTASKSGKIGVMTLKAQIKESADKVKEAITLAAKPVKTLSDLEKIATVSVEDAELGKVIAGIAWKVGIDGFIDVVEGYKGEIETEVIEGMRFPAKVPAKSFVNNPARYEMLAVDCPVLITNYALDNASEVASTFSGFNGFTSKIIIIAPSFSDNVLVNMVEACKKGYFMFPVAVPSLRTEQFDDLAVFCGATFIDKAKGRTIRGAVPGDLGFLEKLIVKDTEAREDAVATGGKGTLERDYVDHVEKELEVKRGEKLVKEKTKIKEHRKSTAIQERINTLKSQIIETQQDIHKKLLEKRIASIASAVGIIRVGDSTQASSLYRKLKIEDAVYACKAALRSGWVKGGGLCLKKIADDMSDKDILREALLAPWNQIQSSVDGGIEIPADVIDPAEAILYAVEHATSVVSNLATVECITIEVDEPVHGEGEQAIARALNELAISDRIHKGQLKESEREMERDRLNGLTIDEHISSDKG